MDFNAKMHTDTHMYRQKQSMRTCKCFCVEKFCLSLHGYLTPNTRATYSHLLNHHRQLSQNDAQNAQPQRISLEL